MHAVGAMVICHVVESLGRRANAPAGQSPLRPRDYMYIHIHIYIYICIYIYTYIYYILNSSVVSRFKLPWKD